MSSVSKWKGNRLQTQTLEVGEDTLTIRSLDWDRDRFDIEFGLEKGTTYNSYLIFGKSHTALVDASHVKLRDQYMAALTRELTSRGRRVDYVIVSHTEPDHSGLIPDVLERYPEAMVCGSKVSIAFLKSLMNRDFKAHPLKGGDIIDLGGGHELEFVMAPNLHWPDTMFSLDRATGIMYTCDAFGAHYCTEQPFDSSVADLLPHYRFYYDCLMKPNARSVLTALRKIQGWEYRMVATGHGPILRENVQELVGYYRDWSAAMGKAQASVAVLYCGDYGYSDRLSQMVAHGITKVEVATEMVDIMTADPAEVREVVGRNQGVVLMAPPSDHREAQENLNVVLTTLKDKQQVFIAESYGANDEPVDTITKAMVDAAVEPIFAPLRVKATPTETDYQRFEEAGTDLAQRMTCKEAASRKRSSMSNETAKAMGRLSTGLYVVTAAHDAAKSAMVASWVQQASFEPLGITVAVAKDRAIEHFMQVNDRFVLNVLQEGAYQHVLKHFLQRFTPGADRFEGVQYTTAPCGAPVLADALAHMECQVVQRMETPDHWITYAEVVEGAVTNADNLTAVHRRKVGNYY